MTSWQSGRSSGRGTVSMTLFWSSSRLGARTHTGRLGRFLGEVIGINRSFGRRARIAGAPSDRGQVDPLQDHGQVGGSHLGGGGVAGREAEAALLQPLIPQGIPV